MKPSKAIKSQRADLTIAATLYLAIIISSIVFIPHYKLPSKLVVIVSYFAVLTDPFGNYLEIPRSIRQKFDLLKMAYLLLQLSAITGLGLLLYNMSLIYLLPVAVILFMVYIKQEFF